LLDNQSILIIATINIGTISYLFVDIGTHKYKNAEVTLNNSMIAYNCWLKRTWLLSQINLALR